MRCRCCGLGYVDPRPSIGEVAAWLRGDTESALRLVETVIEPLPSSGLIAKQLAARNGRVLDVGGAAPTFAAELLSRGWTVDVWQPLPLGIACPAGINLRSDDCAERVPAAFGSDYAAVVISCGLSVFGNIRSLLGQIVHRLAPGGLLCLWQPSAGVVTPQRLRSGSGIPLTRTFLTEKHVCSALTMLGIDRTHCARQQRFGWPLFRKNTGHFRSGLELVACR